jgi:transcriptional regulator with XRE-family HTH domain
MTYQDKLALAARAKVSMGTVEKWLRGEPDRRVTPGNAAALYRAMGELGLKKEVGEQNDEA